MVLFLKCSVQMNWQLLWMKKLTLVLIPLFQSFESLYGKNPPSFSVSNSGRFFLPSPGFLWRMAYIVKMFSYSYIYTVCVGNLVHIKSSLCLSAHLIKIYCLCTNTAVYFQNSLYNILVLFFLFVCLLVFVFVFVFLPVVIFYLIC